MRLFLAPADGINYNFILGMYSFFLALGALFARYSSVVSSELRIHHRINAHTSLYGMPCSRDAERDGRW